MISDLFDVLMLNRYNGWYVSIGDLPAAERSLESELEAWVAKYDKSTRHRVRCRLAGEAAQRHVQPADRRVPGRSARHVHRVFDRFDAVVGEQIWHFADIHGSRCPARRRQRDESLHPRAAAQVQRAPPAVVGVTATDGLPLGVGASGRGCTVRCRPAIERVGSAGATVLGDPRSLPDREAATGNRLAYVLWPAALGHDVRASHAPALDAVRA
jgi:hypothetical protein